jgi:hypothetical protein
LIGNRGHRRATTAAIFLASPGKMRVVPGKLQGA